MNIKEKFVCYNDLKKAVDIWCWNLSHGWKQNISKEWYDLILEHKYIRDSEYKICEKLLKQKTTYETKMKIEKNKLEKKYGHISKWNVSEIKTMKHLFAFKHEFNEDISRWDVSKVRNMSHMFYKCLCFDSPLNTWDVSNVRDMSHMFDGCNNFNRSLCRWDTSNVKTMMYMFSDCNKFNQSLRTHDETIRNINYRNILKRDFCNYSNIPNGLYNLIPGIILYLTYKAWDVSNVTNMEGMFLNCHTFNKSLSHWNTENVTNMCRMFQGCYSFNKPLLSEIVKNFNEQIMYESWNVSNVKNMLLMFAWAKKFNQNLNEWNVDKAKNASLLVKMFFAADKFNPDNIKKWNYTNEFLIFT